MKRKPYIIFIAATALMLGCQQNDVDDIRQPKNYLDVSIQGVTSSNWGTKTRAATSNIVPSDTLWLNDSIYVEAIAEDIATEKAPTTRATPVTNAAQIKDLSIVMFNTQAVKWSASASQESGESPILAKNTNGSYIISTPYIWLEGDMNYRTLIAMSPKHDSEGFKLDASGQTLEVIVQGDVAKQYDLCVSDMSLNDNIQYTIGSNSNQQEFEMEHLMTALDFEAAGFDLIMKSVKLTNICSKATLTLHNRKWSAPTTPADFTAAIKEVTLDSEHIQTGSPWYDITAQDGCLMMLPQSHTDNMKLEFTFDGQNGQPGGTYTMQLNQIKASGTTSSDWEPGMKITYRLRLKTRPAVRDDKLSILNNKAGSTTPVLNIITSTDDDLTFSWTASWLGMYRGTNTTISNPGSNGFFTPFRTGVNNWANVKFFARTDNNSAVADRTATVTVTGKKSGVRTFTVMQAKKVLEPQPDESKPLYDGLRWAKGNLVADGEGRCKIGAPTDYGLYFHFGSLVGWAGGANGDGRGQGRQQSPTIYVKPSDYNGSTSWPAGYFMSEEIGNSNYALPTKDVSSTGIGDPCRFYLGGKWRTPTAIEYLTLVTKGHGNVVKNNGVPGHWFGPDAYEYNPVKSIFFPIAGRRMPNNGSLDLGAACYYWSSSFRMNDGYLMHYDGIREIHPIYNGVKSSGHPVRCVSTE